MSFISNITPPPARAGKIMRKPAVNYGSWMNCFINREMCFTFESLAAVKMIHDEIREIYLPQDLTIAQI